jgi:zinc protease
LTDLAAAMKNLLRALLLSLCALCVSSGSAFAAETAAPARIADRVVRARVAGLDLVICRTGAQDVISFHGSLPAGDRFSPPGNVAIATLVGEMLDKGTARQDKFAIADALESVGAGISFETGGSTVGFSGKFLKKDLALVVGLLAEQLRTPAFAADELTKLKQQLNGYFQRQLESTDYRAGVAFAQALYPAGHPNHDPGTEAYLAGIKAATVDDLKKFHAQYYGPAGAVLVVVGDVDAAAFQAEVAKAFAGWTGGVKLDAVPKAPPAAAARTLPVAMPDKTSVSVLWGQATGLRYTDPDTLALRVGSAILGSGFTGRLMATVRDKEGLTYGIGAGVTNDTFTDGEWRISATFAPSLLEKGVASTKRELTAWIEKGVTADELARRKSNLAGSFQVGLATTDGLAGALLAAINRGLDPSWLDEYPKRVEALTLAQVNAAIKQHLNPAKMTLVEVGTLPGAEAKGP